MTSASPKGHQQDQNENAECDQDEQHLYGVFAQDGCAGLVWLIGQDLTIPGDGDAIAAILLRLALDGNASTGRKEQGCQYKQTGDDKKPVR